MKPVHSLVAFFVIIFVLSVSLAQAAPQRRTALVIGNGSYETGPLRNPVNDAADMANALKSLGFDVTLKKNVRHQEMEEAIEDFGGRRQLPPACRREDQQGIGRETQVGQRRKGPR